MRDFRHNRGQTTLLVVVALVGVGLGVGMFTFSYGKGASYLTNDPAACANCHIMEPQYSAWLTGSHRKAATCNDCHTPEGAIAKYLTKASNGFWHSTAFTSGIFHEPIQIKRSNRAIAEQRCRDCHAPMVHAILANNDGSVSCLSCHQSVGHRR